MTVKEIREIREKMALKMQGMNAQEINKSCKGADKFQKKVEEIRRKKEMAQRTETSPLSEPKRVHMSGPKRAHRGEPKRVQKD